MEGDQCGDLSNHGQPQVSGNRSRFRMHRVKEDCIGTATETLRNGLRVVLRTPRLPWIQHNYSICAPAGATPFRSGNTGVALADATLGVGGRDSGTRSRQLYHTEYQHGICHIR